MSEVPTHVDVLIVGGGPVGGALGLALADAGLRLAVLEARAAPAGDARALALSHASRVVLEHLGAWPQQPSAAVHSVHVSQQGGLGRVKLDRDDLGLPALGHVLPYAALARSVHERLLQAGGVQYVTGARVEALQALARYVAVTVAVGGESHTLTAGLVVLAEGGKLLESAGIARAERSYGQTALIAEITSDRPHDYCAFERFADDGPLALLPLPNEPAQSGGRYALVWTRPTPDPLHAATQGDQDFLAAVQLRIGERAGLFRSVGPRTAFALSLRCALTHHARRVAVVGNAAQTLHPVAGQGFNLGLRDAFTLARLIRAVPREQLGDDRMLKRYAELRRIDHYATVGVTDGLIRLFGEAGAPIRHARGLGLLAMGNCPPLRRAFAQKMVFGAT